MPAEILENPLRLACTFSRGTEQTFRADDTHNPVLTRELLTGLVNLVHPHGTIDARSSTGHYVRSLTWLVKAMAERGHHGGAGELTRARLTAVWWTAGHQRESHTRRMLAALDAETPVLPPQVRTLTQGRHYNQRPTSAPYQPYDETAWTGLAQACRTVIADAWSAHRKALTAAQTGRDPHVHGWTHENSCWLLSRQGPVNVRDLGRQFGARKWRAYDLLAGVTAAREALFPGVSVMLAYQLLFAVYTGIVPDGIADLGLEGLDWAGDATVLVRYLKGRTAQESLTLSPKAVRLLERWLEHSAPARSHCPQDLRTGLWLRFEHTASSAWFTVPPDSVTVATWVRRQGVVDADGAPIRMHRHKIRTTFESHRDRKVALPRFP